MSGAGLACSEHQDLMDPEDTNGQVVTIDLTNFAFSQPTVTIAPGTTVRWRNTTSSFHTVTPDGHAAWTEWQTNTNGETFDVQFNETGTFPYHCVPHRSLGMTGTIVVQ
jgi:plastocyanin